MNVTELGQEAAAAARIMREAAMLARTIDVDATGSAAKADASPVTIVDFAVQAVVASRLMSVFPDDPLVGEEDAAALRAPASSAILARVRDAVGRVDVSLQGEALFAAIDRGCGAPGPRFWTLDPIDGTKGLLRGGQYVVALALIVDGIVQVGAIGCPRLSLAVGRSVGRGVGDRVGSGVGSEDGGERAGAGVGGVAVAARGRGSWWMSFDDERMTPLRTSAVSEPAGVRIAHSVEESHSDRGRLERLRAMLGVEASPVLMDSQAKHVMVAAGEADLLLRLPRGGYREAIWDQAAGTLIIEEAGGRVTDLEGRPFDFSTGRRLTANDGVLASNGRVHHAVQHALAAIRAEA